MPISINPNQGKKGEQLRLDVPSMFFPNDIPQDEKFCFGNRQDIICYFPTIINFEKTSDVKNIYIYTKQKTRNPTLDENKRYDLINATDDIFEITQNSNKFSDYLVLKNGKMNVCFNAYAANTETYRISLFKNHKNIKINNCDVADITLEKGRITEISFSIDDVKNGDYLYAFCTPLNNNLLSLEKTRSLKIFDENYINKKTISKFSNNENNVTTNNLDNKSILRDFSNLNLFYTENNMNYFVGYKDEKKYLICTNKDNDILYSTLNKDIEIYGYAKIKKCKDGFVCSSQNLMNTNDFNCIILDEKLNKLESIDFNDIDIYNLGVKIDYFDLLGENIIYINFDKNINIYNYKTKKNKVIKPKQILNSEILDIEFVDTNLACFMSQNFDENKTYIGYINLDNNSIIYKTVKDIDQKTYCYNKTGCWFSKNTNIGKYSSGIIYTLYNNEFHKLKCEELNESQYGTLSLDGKYIVTKIVNDNGAIVRVYDIKESKLVMKKQINFDVENKKLQLLVNNDVLYTFITTYKDNGGVLKIYNIEGVKSDITN